MAAGTVTATVAGRCVPSSRARCQPATALPYGLDSAAHPAQMSPAPTSQTWGTRQCVWPRGESTLWRGRRGTSTPAPSAPVTVGVSCVRQRCARPCSARAQSEPKTPAAPTAQTSPSLPSLPVMTACPATAGTRRETSSWQQSPGSPTPAPAVCVWTDRSAASQSPAHPLAVIGPCYAKDSAAPIASMPHREPCATSMGRHMQTRSAGT